MLTRAVAPLVLLVAQGLVAQAPTPWSAWKRATFRGNTTFAADAIRRAINWHWPAVVALRDGDLAAASDVIARCVAEGYRHSGFHEVQVRVTSPDGRLDVEIVEGDRLRCGEIVVDGNRRVATADLLAALQAPAAPQSPWETTGGSQTAESTAGFARSWVPANFARCDAASAEDAADAIRSAYAELGYARTRVAVSHQRQGDRVDLHVAVADEGEQVRVASLFVVGERTADLPAVMQRLTFEPGSLFTRSFRADLERQLLRTGRYATVVCDEPPPDRPLLDPLVVRVQRFDHAPADDAAAQRDFRQLLAAFDRLAGHFQAGRGLRATFDVRAWPAGLGAWIGPGPVRWSVDQGAARIAVAAVREPGGSFAPLSCDVTSGGLLLVHGDRWAFAHSEDGPGLSQKVESKPGPGVGKTTGFASQEFRWGVGLLLHNRVQPPLVRLHPTTAAYLLRGESTPCKRDGDDLVLRLGDTDLRIAPDGTVTPRAVTFGTAAPDASTPKGRLELLDEPLAVDFAALRAKLPVDQEVPLLGLLMPLATAGATQWLAARDIDLGEALPLLHSAALLALPATVETFVDRGADRFVVALGKQAGADPNDMTTMLGMALTWLGASWPGDGWPAALLDAGPHLLGEEGGIQRGARHLYELRQDPRLGPLALGSIGATLQLLGYERPAGNVLDDALARCAFDAAFADLDAMTPPDGCVGQALRALGRHWRADPKTAALCAVPDGPDADLAACRAGLQRLWDAGLGAALRRALGEGR